MKTTLESLSALSDRAIHWGHWGLTFMGGHEANRVVATLPFAAGGAGPVDGSLGSGVRCRYEAICQRWIKDGILPEAADLACEPHMTAREGMEYCYRLGFGVVHKDDRVEVRGRAHRGRSYARAGARRVEGEVYMAETEGAAACNRTLTASVGDMLYFLARNVYHASRWDEAA